jgi:hypothetical protein
MPEVIAQPRVDTQVNDGETGQTVRRTDYCGTVWYGAPPDTSGGIVSFSQTYLNEDSAVFLPDSHPYLMADLEGAVVTCSVALQAQPGDASFITRAEATYAADPRGGEHAWVALRIAVYGRQPLGISYRVTAICPMLAVRSGRAIDLHDAFGG